MKLILIIYILLFLSPLSAKTNTIILKESGTSVADLTPKYWTLLASTKGDLNKDGLDDLVFIIQNTDPENIKENKGLGSKNIDLNPRIMAVYFQDSLSKSYKKQKQLDNFIIIRNSPTMDEPLDGISITDKGILNIRFRFWYSAGSWSFSTHNYTFRYDQNHFNLITYDLNDIHRGSGEEIYYSINFLTKKMHVTVGNIGSDMIDSDEWKTFELKKLKNLESLKPLFKWEFMGLFI